MHKKKIEFLFITLSFMQKNLSVLAIQSVYDASMPHPCEDVVRGEILPSAWILEPCTGGSGCPSYPSTAPELHC